MQALHLVEVLLYLLTGHIDGALDRNGRMRSKAQMGKAQGYGLGHKLLHGSVTVTKLGVGVEII